MEYTNRTDFVERMRQLEKKYYYFHYIGPTEGKDTEGTYWFETKIFYKEVGETTLFIHPAEYIEYAVTVKNADRRYNTSYRYLGSFISSLFDTLNNDLTVYEFAKEVSNNMPCE